MRSMQNVRYNNESSSTKLTRPLLGGRWKGDANNDYLLVSQLRICYDIYKRRTDLLGYVNGIPLVFIELKAIHERLEHAYNNNLKDYKKHIPQLFWYNAFIIGI